MKKSTARKILAQTVALIIEWKDAKELTFHSEYGDRLSRRAFWRLGGRQPVEVVRVDGRHHTQSY